MKILVIRHGALGDIVLSLPAFAGIRAHHPNAIITLLTTAPFAALLAQSPWFDHVTIDTKPAPWNLPGLLALRRALTGFDFVYDLQTSSRSSRYHRLSGAPKWSGIAPGSTHRHANPARNTMHSRERIAEQLAIAGIPNLPTPDLTWLATQPPPGLPPRFTALIPGASPHRPEKRWPAANFGALATTLTTQAVILGTRAEQPIAAEIRHLCPTAIDLTGRTTLPQLAATLARATLAIGNDTGPMHLAAALNTRCIVLFGGASDPALTAPRMPDGAWPTIIRARDLADLPVSDVAAAIGDR
ncbi:MULTISPECIES: glycosyltransferase family 9 protein [Acidiphilium]|uniref:ADP-heptose:LPS heptosyltransferase n=1 Tax=Acidiphilium rubrum TaxID=526 RepID=A0A8G2CNA9_ACIRU|nr:MULTISPECIES: glycosyltransferase family 9 protein [Acidiphilium]SIR40492.1 ADP-heptose:LPS heptosyltransferase [Acidiphilium rubrum]